MKLVHEILEDEFGAELISSDEDRARYEDEAEDIKRTLSRRTVAKKMLYGPAGNIRVEITREMFEQAITEWMDRAEILVEVALEQASVEPGGIDKVLLVGGSTRIPLVQQRLEKMFGSTPEAAVNVDECVALGSSGVGSCWDLGECRGPGCGGDPDIRGLYQTRRGPRGPSGLQ